MVHGMEMFVKELVRVHPAVKKVLPCVDNESIGYPNEMQALFDRKGELTGKTPVEQREYPTSITNV